MRQFQLLMHLQRLLDGELMEDAMDDPNDVEALLDDLDEMDTGLAGADADGIDSGWPGVGRLRAAGRARGGRGGDGAALLEILQRIGARRAGRRGAAGGVGARRGGLLSQVVQALDGREARGAGRFGELARLLLTPEGDEDETIDDDPVVVRRRRQILEFRTAWIEALGHARKRRGGTRAAAERGPGESARPERAPAESGPPASGGDAAGGSEPPKAG